MNPQKCNQANPRSLFTVPTYINYNRQAILIWMHLVIKHHKVDAQHDADDSLQSDYFDSFSNTHLHCQQTATGVRWQRRLCAGAEIWYLCKFLCLLLHFTWMSLILPEYCCQVFVCAANQLTTSFLSLGWPFGSLVCKMSGMVQGISVSASVFTLVAIAVDR